MPTCRQAASAVLRYSHYSHIILLTPTVLGAVTASCDTDSTLLCMWWFLEFSFTLILFFLWVILCIFILSSVVVTFYRFWSFRSICYLLVQCSVDFVFCLKLLKHFRYNTTIEILPGLVLGCHIFCYIPCLDKY